MDSPFRWLRHSAVWKYLKAYITIVHLELNSLNWLKKHKQIQKKTTRTFQKSNSITTHRFSLHTHTEKKTLETLDNSLIIQWTKSPNSTFNPPYHLIRIIIYFLNLGNNTKWSHLFYLKLHRDLYTHYGGASADFVNQISVFFLSRFFLRAQFEKL